MNKQQTILNKLKHIEYSKPIDVIKKLSNLHSTKDRVACIIKFNKEHFDKYELALKELNEEELNYYHNNNEEFEIKFFGSKLTKGILKFHEPVFKIFFESVQNSFEYKFEIHKYFAEKQFQRIINSNEFQSDLKSDIKEIHLNKRLHGLKREHEDCIQLCLENAVDIRKTTLNDVRWKDTNHVRSVEVLRVIDGIYSRENIEPLSRDLMVMAIRDHIYLKPYLEKLLLENKTVVNESQKNVFCDSMPLSIPNEHFKVLTFKNSKNGKPFLTQNQFDIFIKKAFFGETDLPKQKFNQAPSGEKLKIQYVFRQFYENYNFEYFTSVQVQDVFIKLLTENFIGWDYENVKFNFNKKPKKLM